MAKTLKELSELLRLREVYTLLTGHTTQARNVLCAFHDDTHPSMSIFRGKSGVDRFLCRASQCAAKGDVFEFIMKHENLANHRQALSWVQDNRGILGVETADYGAIAVELDASYAYRAFWDKVEKDCKDWFNHQAAGAAARAWFADRGVDPRVHALLPVGLFDFEHMIDDLGYTPKMFKQHGMPDVAKAYPNPAIVFSYYDTPASLSRLKLRFNWGEYRHGGKHMQFVYGAELGPNMGLFGLNLLVDSKLDSVTVVEGEFDVLVLQSKFMMETGAALDLVCVSGSAMTGTSGAQSLQSLNLRKIHFWPDNDEAGQKWVAGGVKYLQAPGLYLSVLWPFGYDELTPGEKGGRENRVDPASYCARQDLTVSDICKNLKEGEVYVADWLADNECKTYLRLEEPSSEDLFRLQEKILSIAYGNSLKELTLSNYIRRCVKNAPVLDFDVLWKCASSGYTMEAPTRASIGSNVYISSNDGYLIEVTKKEGPVQIPITDFRIKILKWVSAMDPVEGRQRTFAQCNLLRAGTSTALVLTDKEFSSFTAFKELLHGLDPEAIMDTEKFKKCYDEVIRMLNKGAERVKGTLCLGYDQDTKRYVMPTYVVEDGQVRPNNEVPILLGHYGRNMLAQRASTPLVTDPALLKESAELITGDLLNVHTDKAALVVLLAHIVASPIVEITGKPRGALFFEGATEAGKTFITQLFMNLAWDYATTDGNVSFASTVNFIEMTLSFYRGLPVLVDDAKDEVLEKDKGQIVRMFQAYHDRQGRGRLNSKAETKSPACIQGHLIVTGESLPVTAGSVFRRMVVLTLQRGGLNVELTTKLATEKRHVLSHVWPHYIAWLQRQPFIEITQYATGSSGRLSAFINYMGTALRLFLTFLVEVCGLAQAKADEIMAVFLENIDRLADKNQSIQGQLDDATRFIDGLAQLCHSDPNILNKMPGINVTAVGFHKDSDTVCIYPAIAVQAVGKLLNRNFNISSIGARLLEAGYVESASPDGAKRLPRSVDADRARVWLVPKAKLFATLGMPQSRNASAEGPVLNFPTKDED